MIMAQHEPMRRKYKNGLTKAKAYQQFTAATWAFHSQQQYSSAIIAAQQQQHSGLRQQGQPQQQRNGVTIRLSLGRLFRSAVAGVPQTIIVQQHTIPSFLRRIAAEAVDSCILFLFKLITVYMLVEFEIMSELFYIELICKLFSALIEAIFITYGLSGFPIGCTPGKYLLGLRVVSCMDVQPVAGSADRVMIVKTKTRHCGREIDGEKELQGEQSIGLFETRCEGIDELESQRRKAKHSGSNQSNSEERRNGERRGGGGRNCGALPDRWLKYQIAISQPIGNTRFLAFKTPLGSVFFDASRFKDRQEHRFEVETVIDHVRFLETSLGLVIDLTNTDRYYDCALWSTHKVQYVKIRCPGHEVSDGDEFYQHFRREVKRFFEQRGNDGRLVGVHCTHGLNRTGYLICRYLIEELGWSADNAIEGFRVARGYPMERLKYIDSLKEAEKRLALLQVNGTGQ
uniref:TYR_PHOSPHATASE_2 domain-containing protein n=1 Tax=Globodera pallida TaxID=36090 RepID=A0A183BY40_GLOPA